MQIEAVVTRLDKQGTFVKVLHPAGGCGRCNEEGGCRSGILGQLFGSACREYLVIDQLSVPEGTRVVVEVPDGIPVRAALMAYMLPLICILGGSILAYQMTTSEIFAAGGAVLGGLLGWVLIRYLKSTRCFDAMRPKIVGQMTE